MKIGDLVNITKPGTFNKESGRITNIITSSIGIIYEIVTENSPFESAESLLIEEKYINLK